MSTIHRLKIAAAVLVMFAGGSKCGADDADPLWRFGLDYRLGFTAKVGFENVARPAFAGNPSYNGRSYADGFVGTDSTGNALNLTTAWGYERPSQIVGGQLALRNSQAGGLGNDDNDLSHGFELTAARQLGAGRNIRWGVEVGGGFSKITARSSGVADSSVLGVDSYSMAGIATPPIPPYSGPMTAGPGSPLLGTTPTSVPISVENDLAANVFAFRLGPYVEIPLSKRLALNFGGGLSLAVIDSTYSYVETLPAPYSSLAESGSGSHCGTLVGGYLDGKIIIDLGRGWDFHTGVQWHHLGEFEQTVDDKRSRINLSNSLFWTAGVGWRF